VTRLPLTFSLLALAVVPASVDRTPPAVTEFHVHATGKAFAGDRPLLATISPNGDGVRDRAAISFRLSEPARVFLTISKTLRQPRAVYIRGRSFPRGRQTVYWAPLNVPPRTYLVRLIAVDRAGNRTTLGVASAGQLHRTGARSPVIRVLGVDAAFERPSYDQGQNAGLVVESDATQLSIQLFRSGAERVAADARNAMYGVPAGEPLVLPWTSWRHRRHRVRLRVPALPSGFYYAQLTADDGRVGYAPFVVRPPKLGTARAAVVLPTNTWQAYNFRDEDGDGWGDTWYAGLSRTPVRLGRAFLDRGVPPKFRGYDVSFLRWLHETGRAVDYLAEDDLERTSGVELAAAYDLIVFPGHTEYVTRREYDVVERYRDLGGNLAFLSANNFFWQVERRGRTLRKVAKWRDLDRPEATLIGVQYLANDEGIIKAPYVVASGTTAPWFWDGTGLADGSEFGEVHGGFGIEIDATSRRSPRGTMVLARVPNLYGPGYTAEMTYYETPAGAKVFAAGTLDFGGRARYRPVKRMLSNLWDRISQP
jgi:N,N-dimethylformamidase beta subunit-like protein